VPARRAGGSLANSVGHERNEEGMLKIRLTRTGATKKPSYRIVVAEARSPRDGKYIDLVGHYNPLTEPSTIEVDAEKAAKWVSHGAQMTETVEKLFKRAGVLEQVKPGTKAS
jgi:small subunit ribosomal protein S16